VIELKLHRWILFGSIWPLDLVRGLPSALAHVKFAKARGALGQGELGARIQSSIKSFRYAHYIIEGREKVHRFSFADEWHELTAVRRPLGHHVWRQLMEFGNYC
jgi:hypothetical protein